MRTLDGALVGGVEDPPLCGEVEAGRERGHAAGEGGREGDEKGRSPLNNDSGRILETDRAGPERASAG